MSMCRVFCTICVKTKYLYKRQSSLCCWPRKSNWPYADSVSGDPATCCNSFLMIFRCSMYNHAVCRDLYYVFLLCDSSCLPTLARASSTTVQNLPATLWGPASWRPAPEPPASTGYPVPLPACVAMTWRRESWATPPESGDSHPCSSPLHKPKLTFLPPRPPLWT